MRRTLATFAALLAGSACHGSTGNSGSLPTMPTGPAVATMTYDAITTEAFEKHLKEQSPFIRARYTTVDKKKEFLDGMIRFQLLADEARKEGFDKDPEVIATVDKVMVQKLIHKKFGDEGSDQLSATDLQTYYDAHKDEYVKPERLRLQLIEFKGKEQQGAAKKELGDLKAKNDLAAFGTYAAAHSDDAASKGRNGDTDYKTHDDLVTAYGDGVAAAADKLKQINELSDTVEGKDGWYLLKLIGRQAALNRTFDQVKPALQSRLWHERQNKAFEEYVKQLRDGAHVVVNEGELAKVDVTAPDLSGNGPKFNPQPGSPAPTPPPVAATPPGAGPHPPGLFRPHGNPRMPHGLHPPPPPSQPTQGR
jgi:peptidyl-prolyl cis-trans isomerase C